jgi:hypothetical protein
MKWGILLIHIAEMDFERHRHAGMVDGAKGIV